ncbi:MAG TPA: TPM domain-containing protein [Pyrinomonadaceae bacterium]
MKKYPSFISLAALLVFCWISAFPQSTTPFSINEAPIANNGQPVNDYADVIDDATEQQLNQKIKDFKARTNPPVVLAVATVRTTGERPIDEYSLAIARGWKIGADTQDNAGALLFVAVDDRKYRTEISRDLEDELPDALAGQLQRQYLVPAFRQQDYAKGISDTIDAYIRTIEQRTSGTVATTTPETAPTQSERRRSNSSLSGGACCLIILVLLMIIIFSRGGRNGGNRWGGGGGGFGGSALPWIIGSVLANSASSRGSSWGGGSSSGGGGGGSDWGGFGGGGDFGGGGAGGDW